MDEIAQRRKAGELGTLAGELHKLTEMPEWQTLREVFAEQRAQAEARMAREMFAGGIDKPPLEQRAVDYRRGFLRGVQAVLDAPADADTAFRNAMERINPSG